MARAVAWRWRIDAVDRLIKGHPAMRWRSAVWSKGFLQGCRCRICIFFMLLLEAATLSVAFMLDMTMFFEGKGTL